MAFNMSTMASRLLLSGVHPPQPMGQSAPPRAQGRALPSWVITRFELGYTDKDGAFSVEYTYLTTQNGRLLVDYDSRRILIKDGALEIGISDLSVERVLIVGSSTTGLIFSLAHAPFFGIRNNQGQLIRGHAINQSHRHLGQAINQQILVTFRDAGQRAKFCQADRRRGFPNSTVLELSVVVRGLFSAEKMQQVQALYGKMTGPVAFQVSSNKHVRVELAPS